MHAVYVSQLLMKKHIEPELWTTCDKVNGIVYSDGHLSIIS